MSSCPPTLFLVVFSLGCAPSEEPAPTGQDPVGEVTAWVDRLHAGTVEGFASAGGAGVAASWDASSWHWTSQAEPELLSLTESPVTAAARTSEGLWVVLEDSLFLFDVSLVPVSWSTELDGSVIDLVAVGERLWLFTESSLYARADGRLSQVLVGGETPQAPLAVGPQYLWLARGQAIFALDPASGEVVDGHDLGDPVVAVGVDARGWVYAVTGTGVQVWQEQDVWTELEAPGAVSLRTVHTAEGAWIETLEGWMHHGREGLHVVLGADLAETASALDGLGRLLYTDETGLMRAAASRPVEITGLADGDRVEEPIVVSLVPTAPALLVELSASLVRGGDEVPVLVEADDTLTVDPFGLLFGSWTLRVEARYDDGPAGVSELSLRMAAAGGATWTEHIEPIYRDRCANCHDGASQTVLSSAADWQLRIDEILENVISGKMPLVGQAVQDSEIAVIQAWAAGGFPVE